MSKKALIITDGTETIKNITQGITEVLSGYDITSCTADEFDGTSLLCADVFFIGCENSGSPSFSYLEEMLKHINLAARKCGVFTVNESALSYLCQLVKDSEAKMGNPLHITDNNIDKALLKNWVMSIL